MRYIRYSIALHCIVLDILLYSWYCQAGQHTDYRLLDIALSTVGIARRYIRYSIQITDYWTLLYSWYCADMWMRMKMCVRIKVLMLILVNTGMEYVPGIVELMNTNEY